MPTGQHRNVVRTDTSELKSQLEKKIGRAKTESYLHLLSQFLSLKISKSDFDKLIVATVKKENISLHNALLKGIIKNVCLSKTSPLNKEKKQLNGVKSLCNDLPKSPRKGRTQRRVNKDCNGSKGKSHVTEVVSSSFKQQWSMDDGEEVDQLTQCWRSQPIEAPFGVNNLGDVIKRRLHHVGTCYSSGELPNSISLKKKLEEDMEEEGLEVSAGFANSLNAGLNVFLKRLIKPCLELAASRSSSSRGEVCSSSVSMVDFQVAMELNPLILGEDWSTKLEKIRLGTPDLPADFQTS